MHEAIIKALSPRLAAGLGVAAINGMHELQKRSKPAYSQNAVSYSLVKLTSNDHVSTIIKKSENVINVMNRNCKMRI